MIRIGAMVSGGGTNLQAVLDAIDAGKIDGQVVTVVSSRKVLMLWKEQLSTIFLL